MLLSSSMTRICAIRAPLVLRILRPAAWDGEALYRQRSRCQRILLVALCALAVGCSASKENVRGKSQAAYKLGMAYMREGRTVLALQEFTKAETLAPEDPEIVSAVGLAYWSRREYSMAAEKLRRATELKPDYSEAWNNLGALYIDQGRYEAAIPPLERALKNVFYDTRERALANLGWALFKLGRKDEAEQKLREALQSAVDFPLAQKNLGYVLQDKGQHEEALKWLGDALKAMPDDQDLNLRQGQSLFRTGNRDGARAAFEKAWRLAPNSEVGKSAKSYLDLLQ